MNNCLCIGIPSVDKNVTISSKRTSVLSFSLFCGHYILVSPISLPGWLCVTGMSLSAIIQVSSVLWSECV